MQPAPARNVGFNDQESVDKKGQLGIAGGEEKEDEVDTEKNRNYLAGLEAKLQEGMSLEDASEAMREQDYARDRWTASLSRLPTQTEWEDLVGPKVSGSLPFAEAESADDVTEPPEEVAGESQGYEAGLGRWMEGIFTSVSRADCSFLFRHLMCSGPVVFSHDCKVV